MAVCSLGNGIDIAQCWKLATNFPSLASLVSKLIPIVFLIAGLIFFVLFILAGFNFLTSAGSDDAHAKEKWQQILTYGAIGLIIIFAAYWILQIINYVTGGVLKGIVG